MSDSFNIDFDDENQSIDIGKPVKKATVHEYATNLEDMAAEM
jgi:hypothetical protein